MSQSPDVRGRILVLVRADDPRSAIAQTLRQNGFEVLAFDEAAEAIDRLSHDPFLPDIALLDWGTSSSQLLRFFVSAPRFVRTRIVVLSNQADDIPSLCVSAVLPRDSGASDVLATVDKLQHLARSA